MRLQLPFINVHSEAYKRKAIRFDRCSCFPESIYGVYIGHFCLRHDERYEWIWRQKGWWRRIRLKWMADNELSRDIKAELKSRGIDSKIPFAMREGVIFFNFFFRTVKAVGNAILFKG